MKENIEKKRKNIENNVHINIKTLLWRSMLCFMMVMILSNCSRPNRNWQKNKDFVKKRETIYNGFVSGGGFDIKYDDEGRPIVRNLSTLKKASSDLGFDISSIKGLNSISKPETNKQEGKK